MKSVFIYPLLLIVSLPISMVAQNLQTRFDNGLASAKSLSNTNIEVRWLDILWSPAVRPKYDTNNQDWSGVFRTIEYSYIASGKRYYASSKLLSSNLTNSTKFYESAFDGVTYSTYTADSKYATINNKDAGLTIGESFVNPMVMPFLFLTKKSDSCRECILRFQDIASQKLVLPVADKSTTGSLELSIPGPNLGAKPTTWLVSLDADGNLWQPKMIKQIVPGQQFEMTCKLLNYTNLGSYQFPSRIETTMTAHPSSSVSKLIMTNAMELISARIPESIDDAVFTLNEEKKAATVIWDWSQHGFAKADPNELRKRARRAKTRRLSLSIMFVLAVVPAVIFVAGKIRKKRDNAFGQL